MGKTKKVLIFSDFGVDDIIALIYAYYSSEIEIVGIVADYGNIPKEDALRNIEFLNEVTGVRLPTFGGAYTPLTGIEPAYFAEIHGPAGMGFIVPPDNGVAEEAIENFYEVIPLIEKYKGELIILSVGRLTSLATIMVLAPNAIKDVKEFYIMGGAFLPPGNITAVAEANFYGDPYAANLVLKKSPKKLRILPLDVTKYALFSPGTINSLHQQFEQAGDRPGTLIKPMFDYYYSFYRRTYPNLSGAPIHDLLAMWAISDQAKIQYKDVPVTIGVNLGNTFGQSIGDFREGKEKEKWPVHQIAAAFHYPSFFNHILETFKPRERY